MDGDGWLGRFGPVRSRATNLPGVGVRHALGRLLGIVAHCGRCNNPSKASFVCLGGAGVVEIENCENECANKRQIDIRQRLNSYYKQALRF